MKSIIITGASAGIGAACARRFLNEGWRVGLLARRAEALETVAQGHPNAVILPCDVTDPAQVEAGFDRFMDQAGRLDVLFNNAGMFGRAVPIDQLSVQEWRQVREVNLDGMFLCARAAFGRMRRQVPMGGRIINNGSISAHSPREGSVTYTTTKHAITGLTKTLSLDGRAFDIACGQIDIGNARTDLLEGIIAQNPDNPPPSMDVGDVAAAVVQMANLGPEANVQFMTLMATKMPYIGRG
ncbi:SDR family oxidoreductase [Thalassobius sp. S69A]|uniref:SDR family oxidoreductase n=1 Tax=unclassified Thalassovita TaxID=2619711 RepID=UPI000C0EBFCA|nr:short-chain dehydrogenase [Paracoccaceae bacterium]MBT27063.1 short-chain dehydrogenase [Paracoccaceae bacterium]